MNEIMPFAAWMDLEIILLSKVEGKNNIVVFIMWNQHLTQMHIYETNTDLQDTEENKSLWLPRGRSGEGRKGWELGLADTNYYINI